MDTPSLSTLFLRGPRQPQVEQWLRKALPLYLWALWLLAMGINFIFYQRHDVFAFGDWLIGYQAGWVRRGLSGEALLRLCTALHLNPGLVLLVLWGLLYALFLTAAYALLQRQTLLPYGLLLISPFLLTFPVYAPFGGGAVFRKEWLLLVLLAWSGWAAREGSARVFRALVMAGVVFSPLAVLSHEMLALGLPYLWVVWGWRWGWGKAKGWIVLSALLGGAALAAVLLAPPLPPAAVAGFYAAAARAGFPLRGGNAIDPFVNLTWNLAAARHFWRVFWQSRGGWDMLTVRCLATLALAGVAFWPLRSRLRFLAQRPGVALAAGFSLLGTLAVAWVAIDWGRFLYLHLVSWFILTLLPGLPTLPPPEGRVPWWKLLAAMAYAVGWHLGLYCGEAGTFWLRLFL